MREANEENPAPETAHAFTLEPPERDEPRRWHPILAQRARYCLDCGTRLPPPGDPTACDQCMLAFDPDDPTSFLILPPPPPVRLHEREWFPFVAWAIIYGLGATVINFAAALWAGRPPGPAPRYSPVTEFVVAAGVLILFVPWAFASVYALLVALETLLPDRLLAYYTASLIAGPVLLLAVGPWQVAVIFGLILGPLAALCRQWKMCRPD